MPENRKTLQVELHLTVQGNNKFIRGVNKVRGEIERDILSQYQMKKKWEDGHDYILTIPYDTDEGLEKTIYDIIREAAWAADLRYCIIETDVRALDGSDRYW